MLDGVLRVLLIMELTIDLGKSFREANLLMILISHENLFGAQIRDPRVTRLLIQDVQQVQGTKLVKIT